MSTLSHLLAKFINCLPSFLSLFQSSVGKLIALL